MHNNKYQPQCKPCTLLSLDYILLLCDFPYAGGVSLLLAASYSVYYSGHQDTHTRYSHHSTLCAQFPSDGPKPSDGLQKSSCKRNSLPGVVTHPQKTLNIIELFNSYPVNLNRIVTFQHYDQVMYSGLKFR